MSVLHLITKYLEPGLFESPNNKVLISFLNPFICLTVGEMNQQEATWRTGTR